VDCTAFTQEPAGREPTGPGRPRKAEGEPAESNFARKVDEDLDDYIVRLEALAIQALSAPEQVRLTSQVSAVHAQRKMLEDKPGKTAGKPTKGRSSGKAAQVSGEKGKRSRKKGG